MPKVQLFSTKTEQSDIKNVLALLQETQVRNY